MTLRAWREGLFSYHSIEKTCARGAHRKERKHMSNQETNQKQIQFPAQQELKHLRTRCGKVYALGNNRFRAVVQTTPVHEYERRRTSGWNFPPKSASRWRRRRTARLRRSRTARIAQKTQQVSSIPTSKRARSRTFRTTSACGSATRITTATV